MKKLKMATVLISMLALCACGSGGGTSSQGTISGNTTSQANVSGVTTTGAVVNLQSATLTVPAGTTLTAADGSPVTGDIVIEATYAPNSSFLPAAEQATIPAGKTVLTFVSINITGGNKKVKNVSPPIPIVLDVPKPNGTVVDIYSNSGGANDTWDKEGTATVANGQVTFTVSHFTDFATVTDASNTGVSGGTNGGTTTN